MTLLGGLFGRDEKAMGWGTNSLPTTLTPRDDIITSDTLLNLWGSIALAGDYTATYEEIVRTQLWVRTAVNKLAYTMGSLPLKTFARRDEQVERDSDSPLAALIRRPNQTKTTGTTSQLIARMTYDIYTYANAIVVKVQARPDQPPTELRPVSPRGWVVDDNGDYVWKSPRSNREERFKAWQIIHIIEPGPQHNGFGISRLEAARLTLAIEYAAQRLGAATFNNGARPGGIINVKNLPTEQKAKLAAVERFKSEVQTRFGNPTKAGLPAVLEGDTTWMPMSHNLDDSAVVAHRQLTRMEVASLFDIPQPAIGILDEANFASIDALHLMLYQDTLQWPINLIEDGLAQQLVEGVTDYANQFLEFDLNAVLRGDIGKRATAYNQFLNAGVYTPNELRRLENLPPVDDFEADRIHVPLSLSGTEPNVRVVQTQEV